MAIDELIEAWRSQGDELPYAINNTALRLVLEERSRRLRESLFVDEIQNYWTGLWIVGFLGFWLWLGLEPGGAMGQGYFVALAAATLAVVYFVGYSFFFVAQRRPQVPAPLLALSLREQLDSEIDYISHQIAARTRWRPVLLHLAPPWLACVIVVWTAGLRRDGMFQWPDLLGLLAVTGGWIHVYILERRWTARELTPRKREFESLRDRLLERTIA